ncbi:hypothetical protein [Treponema primitia]|uniref:hypothetical protein n=1 Tax=Treponema primitia TaxID=88058 RepID=UPI0002555090|nr:hypothetical protein [Treponema primitia]
MIKKYIRMAATFSALVFFVFTGCPTGSGSDPEIPSSPRCEIVWAGPRGLLSGDDDWVTIAFKSAYNESVYVRDADGKLVSDGDGGFIEELVYRKEQAVIQFAAESNPGNTAHTEYTYNKATREGFIPKPLRDSPPVDYAAPGTFTIAPDEKSILFADFQGSGSPLTLYKLYPDVGKTFALAALPTGLENTVWVGPGFRAEDWVTLSFREISGGMNAEVSHVADGSQWSRAYTYHGDTKKGQVDYIAGSGFEISNDDANLRILNFYGHGVPVDLTRVR